MSVNILTSGSRLPSEYQEVEYIESTGTQYINTGFAPTNSTKVEMNVQYTNIITQNSGLERTQRYHIGIYLNKFHFGLGNQWINTIDADLLRHTFSLTSSGVAKVDDSEYNLSSTYNNSQDYIFYLFACNSNYGVAEKVYCKLYWVKIYESDTLVRDLIPCYRKSDNEIGLYDTVNQVFYTNQGSGTFTKGNDVQSIVTQRVKANILTSRLPSEYQEVEYIESTGTQYIDTLSEIYITTKIKLTIALDSISGDQKFFGAYGGDGICLGVYDNKWRFGAGTWESSSLSTAATTDKTVIQASGTSWSFNGVNCTATNAISASTNTMSICAIKFLGSIFQYGNIKVYDLEIYDDGVNLSKHFIPCYRITDNEIGLYDIVNGVFYTNDGTGTFAKGNDVNTIKSCKINIIAPNPNLHNLPNTYQEVEYIESTGTQYINIGSIFSSLNNKIYFKGKQNNVSGIKTFLGLYNGSGEDFGFKTVNSDSLQIWNGTGATVFTIDATDVIEIEYNRSSIIVNGNVKTHNQTTTSNYDCYLFGYHDYRNSGASEKASCIMYYLRVNNGTEDIMNLVPCYRKSDNVVGMYDTVNNEFYINSGTGTFIAGNDVNAYVIIKI